MWRYSRSNLMTKKPAWRDPCGLCRFPGTTVDEFLADRGGFEPPIRYSRIHAFQACAFNRSATCPALLAESPTGSKVGYSSRESTSSAYLPRSRPEAAAPAAGVRRLFQSLTPLRFQATPETSGGSTRRAASSWHTSCVTPKAVSSWHTSLLPRLWGHVSEYRCRF